MSTSFRRGLKKRPILKEKAKLRYKIEAKNAELEQRHGLDVARASSLFNMELQATTTILVVNYEENYNSNKPKIRKSQKESIPIMRYIPLFRFR